MSDEVADGDSPFLGEIRIFSFNFAPRYWAPCNGQTLPIKDPYMALFSLLRNQFGGDGRTTFCLPDLRGRVPMHTGTGDAGKSGGESTHTLSSGEMPLHNHIMYGSDVLGGNVPGSDRRIANNMPGNLYGPVAATVPMHPQTIGFTGWSQAHQNMQPYLGLNFCICMNGEFPSANVFEGQLAEVLA